MDCATVRASVARLPSHPGASLSAGAARHLVDCALCRGALIVLVCELAGIPAMMTGMCVPEDLATFLEVEGEAGTLAAVQEWPGVWWHLWTCEDCAQSYARFQTLREG